MRAGLIRYVRGPVGITDQAEPAAAACDRCRVTAELFARLAGGDG